MLSRCLGTAAVAAIALAGAAAGAGDAATPPAPAMASAAPAVAAPPGAVSWVVGLSGAGSSRLAAALRRAGASVEPMVRLNAIAVSGGDRAGVVAALRGPGIVYIERRLARHLLAEPADATDAVTGRPFDWAFGEVRADAGLSVAGGGAPGAPVAVVDSGVDREHPDLAGRVREGRDVLGQGSVEDLVGHGTFVAGLISAIDGNGAGGRGVAGATPVIPVRVTTGTAIDTTDVATGIVAAVDLGARVINLSLGGPGLSALERSALDYARQRDVLVVASAGNSGEDGNPPEYPAAAIGGDSGGWSAGLSVGATDPLGRPASFSTHNRAVSLAAPGAGMGACTDGVYSTIPGRPVLLWSGGPCDRVIAAGVHGPGRYAYGEGTSFSAPLVAGAAALVRQVTPVLRADQAADVLRRSARQTRGTGWNEYTGAGVLDVGAAVALATRYDVTPPAVALSADDQPGAVRLRASADDRTGAGRELAGGQTLTLEYSRDGTAFFPLADPAPQPYEGAFAASPAQPLWFRATSCDRNRNCASAATGPLTGGAAPGRGAATAAAASLRLRILELGVTRRCPVGGPRCLRLVWRADPAGRGRVTFSARARQPGGRAAFASARGTATAGGRRTTTLPLRRRLDCGRAVVRLTIRQGGEVRVRERWVAVRRGCRR